MGEAATVRCVSPGARGFLTPGPNATFAGRSTRVDAVLATQRLLGLARDLNSRRPPDHREQMAAAVANTEEYFRAGAEAPLPSPRADALLDRVQALAAASDSSRDGYEEACLGLELALRAP
jgi:hypothetical protein